MNALLHKIRKAGLDVALDDGTLVITGLDALPEADADAWLVRLREHKGGLVEALAAEADLVREGGGETGMGWWPGYPDANTDMPSYEAAGTLKDLAERYGLRLTREGETFKVRYPRGAAPNMVVYGDLLLAEALPYIREKLGVAS